MEALGGVNVYFCNKCKAALATINLSVGVTPMNIACKCCQSDFMVSCGYVVTPFLVAAEVGNITVAYAWIRQRRLPEDPDHYLAGGLTLVPLKDAESLEDDRTHENMTLNEFLSEMQRHFSSLHVEN